MATLLEKRQAAALRALETRKAKAEAYIAEQRQKLETRLQPHILELSLVEKMIAEHRAANPELPIIHQQESQDAQ